MTVLTSPEISSDSLSIDGVRVTEIPAEDSTNLCQSPLVLLNGIGAGNSNWGGFPEALGRACVLVDVSAAERAHKFPAMYDYSDALDRTLERLGYDQVDMLGVSWGGALAQETAIRHPDRIGNLVLAATLHGWTSIPPKFSAAKALLSKDRTSEAYKKNVGNIYGGDARWNPGMVEEAGIVRKINPVTYADQKHAIMTWNHYLQREMLIKQRTLVMAGADDPIARPLNARFMAAAIPNSTLHIVSKDDGGGHLFLHTRPQESAKYINRFLNHSPETKPLTLPLSLAALTGLYLKTLGIFFGQ